LTSKVGKKLEGKLNPATEDRLSDFIVDMDLKYD
jgi:hypothetical protein